VAAPSEAWAATGSWRGDLKLFARIAEKAADGIAAKGQSAETQIEFAVREDHETYDSVEDLLKRVPANTTRGFRSARISVGGPGLRADVRFGRKKPEDAAPSCQKGVAVEISSDGAVNDGAVAEVRSAVAKVVARGGFEWVRPPTEGPTEEHGSLAETQAGRWREREIATQAIFAGITLVVLAITAAIFFLFVDDGQTASDWEGLLSIVGVVAAVLGVSQGLANWLSLQIFPAIEIADVTPGRRLLRLVGGSGLISAGVSVLAAFAKTLFS